MAKLAGPLDPSKPSAAPDPDVLLATTYGQGSFAINLAPLILGNTVSVTPTAPGTNPGDPPFVGTPITISGTSEITRFGNTTWITVEDVTDPTAPKIIAGFDPNGGCPGSHPRATRPTRTAISLSTSTQARFYTSNGVKTIEVFATDDAGSVGNKVVFTFNFDPATQLHFEAAGQPPATAQPGANFASPNPVLVDADDKFGNIATTYNGPVTITLAGGATGLGGTVTVNAVAGVATFTNLSISHADGTSTIFWPRALR